MQFHVASKLTGMLKGLWVRLTAFLHRVLICAIPTVADLIAHLSQADAATISTQELVRGTRRVLCNQHVQGSQNVNAKG